MANPLQLGVSSEYTILIFIAVVFVVAFFIARYFKVENMDGIILIFLIVMAIAAANLSFMGNIFYLVVLLFFIYLYFRFKPKTENSEVQ